MYDPRDFTVGGVIRETFRIARLRFLACFVLALAVVELPKWGGPILIAPMIADLRSSAAAGHLTPLVAVFRGFALGAVPGLVAQLGVVLLTGTVVRMALDDVASGASGFGPGLRAGLAAWPGNVALTVIYYACFLLGLVVLIVPGLILSCMWAVFLPAHMAEGDSFLSCFARSSRLTKGCRWRIFGLTLIYGLLVGGLVGFLSGFANGLASSHVPSGVVIAVRVIAALLGAAVAVVSAAGVAAIYLGLRGAKEGALPASVVEAFT